MIRMMRALRGYCLTKQCAESRSQQLLSKDGTSTPISYKFDLALHPGNQYEGVGQIHFYIHHKSTTNQLFLDFNGRRVQSVMINNQRVDPSHIYSSGRLSLPSQLVKAGPNSVCVSYQNEYDSDGSGCVSFIDVDKKQYLYTQFEPYMANRVFPMFDQPDLKATLDLTISCPSQWGTVLSNEAEEGFSKHVRSPVCEITRQILEKFTKTIPNNYKRTSFKRTKVLPTYLFCFVVGPYRKYIPTSSYRNIPMSYYCIESLYPHLQKLLPFIEEMTNKSMQFFEGYFGYPYPFSKYDQIFAHEYKWGAMENAGIVTLNDLYIFKDPVSTEKMIGFGNTIVHQMAHHWFGNLVTMKWWDDLWLNQSFAEYISHFCLEKIKPNVNTISYESAMCSFLNRKSWGYAEDQLITTHPIRSHVANTQVAESIFDGITYSKGAATMKQLMYLMGEKQFSNSLREYFHKYEFRNAELTDLLEIMKKYYQDRGVSIDQWREMWLEKAGLNILSAQFEQNTSMLVIKQIPYHKQHPTLRSHTIKVALLQSPKVIYSFEVVVSAQETTKIQLSSEQAQKFKQSKAVLLNYDDLSFCKCIIDSASIAYLKQHLGQVDDVLLRSIVWKSFFDMVKDAHLKATDYIDILAYNLLQQESDAVLEQNLTNAVTSIEKYMPHSFRPKCRLLMLTKCRAACQKDIGKNREIILRDKIIAFSDTGNQELMNQLVKWYDGNHMGGAPNITERWKIIVKVLSSDLISKHEKRRLLDDMVGRDSSDTMKNKKLTCNGLLLEDVELEAHFEQITNSPPEKFSMTTFVHSIAGLNNRVHLKALKEWMGTKYFDSLKVSLENPNSHSMQMLKKSEFIQLFIDHMDPMVEDCSTDLQAKMDRLSKIRVLDNDKIKIQLLKKVDILQKRLNCYRLYD